MMRLILLLILAVISIPLGAALAGVADTFVPGLIDGTMLGPRASESPYTWPVVTFVGLLVLKGAFD